MYIDIKKVAIIIIILLLIGFTPAYSFKISECYSTYNSGDFRNNGAQNSTLSNSNITNLASDIGNTSLQLSNNAVNKENSKKISKSHVNTVREKRYTKTSVKKDVRDTQSQTGNNSTAKKTFNTRTTDKSPTIRTSGSDSNETADDTSIISDKTTTQTTPQTSISRKLQVDELKSNNIAYVVINGTSHYTTVKEIKNNTILLSDPGLGNIEMTRENFTKIYSGYALIVNNPSDFYKLNQELTNYSEKSEEKYTQFIESYKKLKQSTSKLDDAYLTKDKTKISDALSEHNKLTENFLKAKDRFISLKENERELGGKIVSFIEEGVSSGIYSNEFLDEAKKNEDLLIENFDELSTKLSNLTNSLNNGNMEQLKSNISSLDEYLNEMNQQSQIDITSTIIRSTLDLSLKTEETVNQKIDNILNEIEININDSKEELDKIELIYKELSSIKNHSIKLALLKCELILVEKKTKLYVSNRDITTINSIEDCLSKLLTEIDTKIESNAESVSNSTNDLQNIKVNLQGLYKLVTQISKISPNNQKPVKLKQDISSILNRIDTDFKNILCCWYLLGENDKELRDIVNNLKGIERNLERANKKNQYKNIINKTKNLETSSSDLRNLISTERGEIKNLAQELRYVGIEWAKIYREFVDHVLPVTIDPVYLNETIDAQITPQIRQKALELGNDPIQIYNYVRNLSYDTYYGSSRGSVWTLSGGAGNDYDKSSLLVALLRVAGYPARYVQGWIQLNSSTLIGILEGKNITVNGTSSAMSIDQALNILQDNGIPYEQNENIISLEHVWVEVAMPSKTKNWPCICDIYNIFSNTTKRWSFEYYDFKNMKFDLIDFFTSYINVKPSYEWLPLDPSFSNYTVSQAVNYAEIPGELRHKVQITTSDGIDSGLIPIPLLAKEKIILKYVPADEGQVNFLGDQSIYRLLDNGGKSWSVGLLFGSVWWTGPYYAYVTPELIIGNQTVSTGNAVTLGSGQTLNYTFTNAKQNTMQDIKGYKAGDMYSITLSPTYEPSSRIGDETSKTTDLKQEYNLTGNASTYDDMVSQLLYTTGITYYAACDKTEQLLGETYITKSYHPIARCDYVSRGVRYWENYNGIGIYRVYANYMPGAISHDVPIDSISSYSKIGQEEGCLLFNLKAGFTNSGWESQSIYGLFNVTAVSTTYIIAYAQSNGIPVYSINSDNIDEILPKLRLAQWVIDEIRNDVNAGYQVIIPETEVTIGQWHGIGWAVLGSNGFGAYIISGGLNSNSTNSTFLGGWGTEPMNIMDVLIALERNWIPFVSFLDSGEVNKDQYLLDTIIAAAALTTGIALLFMEAGTTAFAITLGISFILGITGLISVVGLVYSWVGVALLLLSVAILAIALYKLYVDPNGEIIEVPYPN
jgi:hypothetical protein